MPNRLIRKDKIVFCIGANYWSHLAVTILSMVQYSKMLDIAVFHEADNPRWRSRISAFVTKANSRISFFAFETELLGGLKECGYLSLSAYYRLFTPHLIESDINRILYLDSDLILRSSVDELLALDLEGNVLAARPAYETEQIINFAKGLKRSPDIPYFNSGVMIIDVAKWREERITEKAIAFAKGSPDQIQFADQCALNHVIGGQFTFLLPAWNVGLSFWDITAAPPPRFVEYSEIVASRSDPKIVHYNGRSKPWHYHDNHPWKHLYVGLRRRLEPLPYVSDDTVQAVLSDIRMAGRRAMRLLKSVARSFLPLFLTRR